MSNIKPIIKEFSDAYAHLQFQTKKDLDKLVNELEVKIDKLEKKFYNFAYDLDTEIDIEVIKEEINEIISIVKYWKKFLKIYNKASEALNNPFSPPPKKEDLNISEEEYQKMRKKFITLTEEEHQKMVKEFKNTILPTSEDGEEVTVSEILSIFKDHKNYISKTIMGFNEFLLKFQLDIDNYESRSNITDEVTNEFRPSKKTKELYKQIRIDMLRTGDDLYYEIDNEHQIYQNFYHNLEVATKLYNPTTLKITTDKNIGVKGYDLDPRTLNRLKDMKKNPENYMLTKTDVSVIKDKWQRLESYFNYKSNIYQFYPNIIQKDFYTKIYKKKEFYMNRQIPIKVNKSDDIQKDLCPSENTNFKLQTHQKFMKSYLSVNTPFNGLLIFHGTGSGKTCSSITIAESYKNLIALSSKKILVILAKSVKSNFIKEIHDISRGYNQCTSSEYLNYDFFTNVDKKKKSVRSLIDKFYDLVTFGSFRNMIIKKLSKYGIKYDVNKPLHPDFINWIDLMFSDKVIIVDEVHNLKKYKDDHGQDLEAELFDKSVEEIDEEEVDSTDDMDILEDDIDTTYFKPYHALEVILKYAQNVKLVLLSATPMYHSPIEIVSLLNLMLLNDKYKRIDHKKLFSGLELTTKGEDILRVTSQGYISYLRTESPFTFAKRNYHNSVPIHNYVNNKLKIIVKKFKLNTKILNNDYKDPIKIVLCPMSNSHEKFYTTSLNNKISLSKIIEYGNISKDNTDTITSNQLKLNGSDGLLSKENSISSKVGAIISNILSNVSSGTNFAYSWYVNSGTEIIAKALLENGVEMAMYSKSERKISSADQKYIKQILGGKKTYKQPEPSKVLGYDGKTKEQWRKEGRVLDFKPMRFSYIIGKIEEDERDNLINFFNLDKNRDGSIIKIMVGSGVFKEGISLKNVRQVHLLEPWHNRSRIEQVIGRALRHCSHKKLPPKDRQVDIYQYAVTYNNIDNISINRKNLKNKLKYFTEENLRTPKIITGEFAKSGIFSYDIIMYMRSQILYNLVLNVKDILQETAIDCAFNREINIKTLEKKDQYECFKSLSDKKDKNNLPEIEYFSEKDYNINEEELDFSTFDEFFYEPHIVFVINVLKKIFEIERTTYILKFSQILENPIFDDQIYFEKDSFIIRSALYRLIPKHDVDLRTFPHIIGKKIGRNRIYGYIFGRETNDGGLFIFQPFEDQQDIKDATKPIKRSDFERAPMYEKTEYENLSPIEMPFSNVSTNLRKKYEDIILNKKKVKKDTNLSTIKRNKILNANELIKEREISLNDSKEADKNAPLIGLILDVSNLPKMVENALWGEKGYHLWLREKVMICKKGKRSSIGQLSTSFSVSNFQCMFNDYIFIHKINSNVIINMMKKTKNKRAIIFAKDMEGYPNIIKWFEDRSIKGNRSKTAPAIKKLDYANIIYIIFKYFESIKTNKSIWIRRLY